MKACVVRRPGSNTDEKDIIDYLRARLAHFKCPKSAGFFDSLPRNPTGKVLKRTLREAYWKEDGRQVS